jgi:hypothetical protein
MGGWRKLHNEEPRELCCSPSVIRMTKSSRMRWAGHVGRMGMNRNACVILVGKSEGKRPLRKPRRRCVNYIKMNLTEIGWGNKAWIDLDQDRDQRKAPVNTVMNFGFHKVLWIS